MKSAPMAVEAAKAVSLFIFCFGQTVAQVYELQASGKIDAETRLIAEVPSQLRLFPKEHSQVSQATGSADTLPEILKEYSVCVAFLVFSFLPRSIVYNYFTEALTDSIDLEIVNGSLYVSETFDSRLKVELPIYPEVWYQMCVVAALSNIKVYHSGVFLDAFPRSDHEVPLGGMMAVGTDQDSPGGSFSMYQSFRGRVASLGMWARALSLEEVTDVVHCKDVPGNLLPWGTDIWNVYGKVHKVNDSDCPHLLKQYIPFWERLSLNKARKNLERLGMELAAPQSQGDVDSIVQLLDTAPSDCIYEFADKKYTFIGNNTIHKVISHNDNETAISNIYTYVSEKNESYKVLFEESGDIFACIIKKGCYLGEYFTWRPKFYLHGLCDIEDWEEDYAQFYVATSSQNPLYFVGMAGELIRQTDLTWQVIHRYKGLTLASMESISLPLGRRKWNVTGKDPLCTFSLGFRTLVLSICSEEQFTCNDGSCVPLSSRCNLSPDCNDWSDEDYCQTVSLPKGYLNQLPPPPPINLSMAILFRHIRLDLKSMTFTMKLTFKVQWHDGRINFLNLRKGWKENEVSKEGEDNWVVWVPKLQLSDTMDHGHSHHTNVYVLKQTNGSHSLNDLQYSSTANALLLVYEAMPTFNCPLNLRMYPRDTQTCKISIKVANAKRRNIHVVNHEGKYLGETDLQEYKFDGWWMNSSGDTLQLSFQLIRYHEKHLWTTIVPTSLLLVISYGTLFIPLGSFSERGAMSLTTLLVLVSLYTETLSSLPVTSYNKTVEKWYILIIVYVSLIIAVHLATSNVAFDHSIDGKENHSRECKQQDILLSRIFWKRHREVSHWLPHPKVLLHGAQVLFAIMIIGIVIVYSLNLF